VDYHQILPQVYVGACPRNAENVDLLKSHVGITAVLNLQTEDDFDDWGINWYDMEAHYRKAGIEVRRTPVQDFDADALRRHLPKCVEALDGLLKDGHSVYVHCSAGINRSPSTVIAYLHWVEQWDWERAIDQVISNRPCDPYLDVIQAATEDRNE